MRLSLATLTTQLLLQCTLAFNLVQQPLQPRLQANRNNDDISNNNIKRIVSETLTTDDPSLTILTGTVTATATGFTMPTSETSTPTETATITVNTNTPDTSLIATTITSTNSGSSDTATSVGTIVTPESTTNTAGEVNPIGTATQNLSGGTNTATGTSASATGAAGTVSDSRDGSTVALVVAIAVGLMGWVGL